MLSSLQYPIPREMRIIFLYDPKVLNCFLLANKLSPPPATTPTVHPSPVPIFFLIYSPWCCPRPPGPGSENLIPYILSAIGLSSKTMLNRNQAQILYCMHLVLYAVY
jgi:hypothetical protein